MSWQKCIKCFAVNAVQVDRSTASFILITFRSLKLQLMTRILGELFQIELCLKPQNNVV